jgi:hypothetical protein
MSDTVNTHTNSMTSQQVSWWDVHQWVVPRLERVGTWPLLGTPAWVLLDDRDPVKWAAVLDGGQHHALRLELNQEAFAEASRAVASAADWAKLSREAKARNEYYSTRLWLRRVV